MIYTIYIYIYIIYIYIYIYIYILSPLDKYTRTIFICFFFLIKDIRILFFHVEHYIIKTDII